MGAPDLSRDEWLQLRRKSLGASEAAAACGEDPTVSPLELVFRKRGDIPEADLSDIEAIQWGNLLEPAIVAETARRAGLVILQRQDIERAFADDPHTELVGFVEGRHPFLRSRARPWQTATPDGIAIDSLAALLVGIEAKNAGLYHSDAWDTEEGRAPEKFQVQVAHQLSVVPRLSAGILSGLVGGNSLRSLRLDRERIRPLIEAVVTIEARVWLCVETGAMPELSGPPASVARALKALHPDDNGDVVLLDEATAEAARELERLKDERKVADERIATLSNLIRAAIGPATFGVLPAGAGTYSHKTQERPECIQRASKFRVLRFSKSPKPSTAKR